MPRLRLSEKLTYADSPRLMGGLSAAQDRTPYGGGPVLNAFRAVTELPQPGINLLTTWLFDDSGIVIAAMPTPPPSAAGDGAHALGLGSGAAARARAPQSVPPPPQTGGRVEEAGCAWEWRQGALEGRAQRGTGDAGRSQASAAPSGRT
jgi:hypothetical protein